MKIYRSITIDMKTLETIKEDSFEYSGPIAECKKGGGGSSGGGGGTGQIHYPAYVETIHSTWLTDVDGYMDAAIGNSPFTTAVAYIPDDDLDAMDTAIVNFNTVVDAMSAAADYASYSDAVVAQVDDNVISTTTIDAAIAAHAAVIDADYDDMVTKLQSGMRDIGAAMTSSFVVAQADLYAKKERDLTSFGAKLYVAMESARIQMIDSGIKTVFGAHIQRIQFEESVAKLVADMKRIRIVAKGEEVRENYDYDERDVKWDLEMTSYATAMLAGPGGGVAVPNSMSKTQSALSGALSGAAMGAMAGAQFGMPGLGAGIGGAMGLLGGLF